MFLKLNKSFKFIDHTADIAAELTGSNLEELFTAGAEAWLAASTDVTESVPDDLIDIELSGASPEELLITFLNELNFLLITKKWLCLKVHSIKIFCDEEGCELSAELGGTKITQHVHLKHEIKSVTYHQVEIVEENGRYSTLVVFDI